MSEIWKDIVGYEGLYQVSSICGALKGRHKQVYGYRWEYKKGDA